MNARKATAVIVKDLTVTYNKECVLKHINLSIPTGQMVAIVGPNGAGKTTLLKALLQIVKTQQGEVIFPSIEHGVDSGKIAYVPQSGSVDWDFPITVIDVVIMGMYGELGWFKKAGKREKKVALEMLEKVGMSGYENRQIGQLSGGQKQRVFLARALVQNAEIYLMDEPFKGVDAVTELVIVNLLKELRNQGKTVIVVHHDLDTVKEYFDWSILINKSIVACGPVKDVCKKENLYLTYHRSDMDYQKVS